VTTEGFFEGAHRVIAFLRELVQTGIYKRSQGRITRQITFAAIALTVAIGCWRLSENLDQLRPELRFGIPAVLLALSAWIAYRIVNFPNFADFLIAVEAEMNKVSWPTRSELIRASLVVLITIFVLATVLTIFDLFWSGVFQKTGIL
jgi:preprotein translocase subunit SecE